MAESVYWMERYRERAENTARFIEVCHYLSLDLGPGQSPWGALVHATSDYALFEKAYPAPTEKNVIEFLLFNKENPNSLLNCLYQARENARSVRQIITSEMWQEINTTYLFVHDAIHDPAVFQSPYAFFNHIKRQCQLFIGIADSTMTHQEAWHFGRVGHLTERANQTSRILDVKYYILLPEVTHVGTPIDHIQWSALLKSASAFEMYRKHWHQIEPDRIIDFLVFHPDFPRSIAYCLKEAEASLSVLCHPLSKKNSVPLTDYLKQLNIYFHSMTVSDTIKMGLHEFLDNLQSQFNKLNDLIFQTFFSITPISHLKIPVLKGENE
jgi:uncharacterized alpha-E superfamily protein